MPVEILIARWVAVMWIVFGLSHAVQPRRWAELLMPLRDKPAGGLILASMSLPIGLIIVLGHNVWVWGLPVIVTVAGWMTTTKSVVYLLVPRAHTAVMSVGTRPERGFRVVGVAMVALGSVTAYDAFVLR